MITYDSPEAAKLVTVELWKASNGNLYSSEEAARYSSCTHRKCQNCDNLTENIYTHCPECREKLEKERYFAREIRIWDEETPLYSEANDSYFFPKNHDLEDYLDGQSIEDARFLICDPIFLSQIDYDYWTDDLAEDQELDDDVINAVNDLNEVLDNKPPVSWMPGKYRPIFTNGIEL